MFVFLSKLLPLFIYPLGISCLLMLVSLVLVWKAPKKVTTIAIASAFLILLTASNSQVAGALMRSLEFQHIPSAAFPQAQAIVVLGGGIKPQAPPRPWVDLAEGGDRILYGVELYRQGKAPLLVLSGGRIDWRMGGASESGDMAKIALWLGIPQSAILEDPTSLNTHQNAVNVRQLLQARGINQILLVTSASHMPRALKVFQRQGFKAIAAPTDFITTQNLNPKSPVTLEETLLGLLPQTENLGHTTTALKEYIGLLVYGLKGWL